ncbi:MAG: toll/interleukin-1 receptor domain-containing protein [candidate division Zixibacteria bacterium]
MKFSNVLGSFEFHILILDKVYTVSCPREGKRCNRDGEFFNFQFSCENESKHINIFVSGTLLAELKPENSLEIAMLNVAKKKMETGNDEIELHTGNFKSYLFNTPLEMTNEMIRGDISNYIKRRYDAEFEKSFTVIEIILACELSVVTTKKQLHFMHKHKLLSFSWPSDIWMTLGSESEWFVQDFSISADNYINLTNQPQNLINVENAKNIQQISKEWDFFICHASEDKKEVVEPLAMELNNRGAKVWYDDWTLSIGDSLSQRIDDGLKNSKYGIVIISKAFFSKPWPQRELSGLVQKEIKGNKVILPVWHKVDHDYVVSKSPTLADKLAGSTDKGISELATKILKSSQISL